MKKLRLSSGLSNFRSAMIATIMIVVVLALSAPVLAASNGTLDVTLYNPLSNSVKFELFQVGAPFPSRQTILPTGPSSCGLDWYNLVTTQEYFVRITDPRTGRSRQSFAFKLYADGPGAITLDWFSSNFVTGTHHLDY